MTPRTLTAAEIAAADNFAHRLVLAVVVRTMLDGARNRPEAARAFEAALRDVVLQLELRDAEPEAREAMRRVILQRARMVVRTAVSLRRLPPRTQRH